MLLCARHRATALASRLDVGSSFSAHLPSIADSPHIRGNGQIPSKKAEQRSGETDARQGGAAGRQTNSGYAGENPQSWNRSRHRGHGVGHGIAAATRQFVGPPARFLGGAQGAQVDAQGIQRGSATRLYGVAHHGPRSAIGQRAGPWRRRGRARPCTKERGFEIPPAARRSADAARRLRRHRQPAVARSSAARGPTGILRSAVDAAPSTASGEIGRRQEASSSRPNSSRKAISRRRSRSWSRASSAAIARRSCSASPARERPSRWRR